MDELLIELDSPSDAMAMHDVLNTAAPDAWRKAEKDGHDRDWILACGGGSLYQAIYFVVTGVDEQTIRDRAHHLSLQTNWPEGSPHWSVLGSRPRQTYPA
ncbi:hypothetical protein FNH13_17670 [Ornithinimicrobium ciconiae]|uniref:Uncharacterized protein n=1 Tax=Ornithinimicrobium ciconiae TaxID=2594265 RepID=A0A516GEH5_9MICO|nr:hypothetical protein [Ornithinimicrobium ciconiae]QDO89929.1 hypothetical protein FNH13_17670 [Ornithinimicrobium ciconiae]